ncbi:MAG: LuxR C-terminal-related transcriptional regulator [Ilumatobacteraceae bacterium]
MHSPGRGDDAIAARATVAQAPFVGRHDDLVQLCALLGDPTVRLVSITGPGGIGKTRLVDELLRRLAPREGLFVELASLGDPSLVVTAIASELSLNVPRARSAAADVANELVRRDAVLVLDNFEHLLGATDDVLELLARAPALQVVVTSRVPLHVRSEHIWRVGPLDVPDELDGPTGEESALALFRSVAGAAQPDLQISAADLPTIAAICRHLAGHPLAIELTASRSASTRPDALLTELESRSLLDVALDPERAPTNRQRDLRAVIGWSYAQLDDITQAVLRRLSVFEDWAVLNRVEVVCADAQVPAGAVLDALATLVDHHLLEADHRAVDSRYRLPRPIRDAARELLDADPHERERTVVAHLREHQTLARACIEHADEPGALRLLQQVRAAEGDLMAALDSARALADVTAAVDLTTALARMWLRRGSFPAHVNLLDGVAALDGIEAVDEITQLLFVASSEFVHAMSGVVDAQHVGETARSIHARAVACSENDPRRRAVVLRAAMRLAAQGVDFGAAWAIAGDLLALPIDDERARGIDEILSGMVAHWRDDTDAAVRLGLAGYPRAVAAGDRKAIISATLLLQPLERRGLIAPGTVPDLETAAAMAHELGDDEVEEWVRLTRASNALLAGDHTTAARHALHGLQRSTSSGAVHGTVLWAVMMAMMSASADPWRSAVIHGALGERGVLAQSAMIPSARMLYEMSMGGVRDALGPDRYDAATQEGAALGWAGLVAGLVEHARALVASNEAAPSEAPDVGAVGAEPLTPRELEVLRELALGRSNRDISIVLDLSPKTVMHHTTAIYRKLAVGGRAEAVAAGRRLGLLAAPTV